MPIEDDWDFYPCEVDNNPASMSLNLAIARHLPLPESPTLLWIGLQMLEAGDHGRGIEPDVKQLFEAEDRIVPAAKDAGMIHVGRLRNAGDWQLTFYGRPEHEAMLDDMATAGIAGPARGYRTGAKEDPDWDYYRDFMYPDAERHQWIMDRRVVDQLREQGDALGTKRPIDHYIDFPPDADLTSFLAAVDDQGFSLQSTTPSEDGKTVSVQLVRDDALADMAIHYVVMLLVELAVPAGGDYNGWGSPITKSTFRGWGKDG